MDVILPYVVWMVLVVLALSVAAVLLFGARGLVQRKADPVTVGAFALPALLVVVLRVVLGGWVEAGIVTMLVMLALAALALVFSGSRSLQS